MVEFDAQRPAQIPEGDRGIQPAVPDPEVVQQAQGLPGEVPELRMVPFGLQFRDHDDREHDFVLVEAGHGVRIGQQDAGVENIGAPVGHAALCAGHHGRTYPLGRGWGATASRSIPKGEDGPGFGHLARAEQPALDVSRTVCTVLRVQRASRASGLHAAHLVTTSAWFLTGRRPVRGMPSNTRSHAARAAQARPSSPTSPVRRGRRAGRKCGVSPRSGGGGPRSHAGRAGSRPGGRPTRRPRRSSTPNGRSARA